jgi:prephenate dehydrogenase
VAAFDVRPFAIKNASITRAKSVAECAGSAELAVVCVPVKNTPALVRECAGYMKPARGAAIAEISSVKSGTFQAMRRLPAGILPLCIHPMFGPGADPGRQLRMLLVPVRDGRGEEEFAKRIFAGMSVKVLPDARTHDRAIAAVLGLTYFVNVAYAGMLSREKLDTLKGIGGTTFAVQSMLTESVMTDEPELVAALLRDNPYSARYIGQYLKGAGELARLASGGSKGGRLEARVKRIQGLLQKQQDLQASYKKMYEMLQSSSSSSAAAAGDRKS